MPSSSNIWDPRVNIHRQSLVLPGYTRDNKLLDMPQNEPTNVIVWITTSSPFEGVTMASEGEMRVNDCEQATLKNAVHTFYSGLQNLPASPLPFGVRTGNNVMMQGVIEAGGVIATSSFATN
jgi:hypothetical protein